MAFFSNPVETANRFGNYIEEFQKIFSANGCASGSPDDFFAVARKLSSNRQLSADLSTLVKSIIDRESGTVSLRTILTIIALASGGPQIAESARETSKPINLFIDFLIAVGGNTRIDSEQMDGMYPVSPSTPEADGGLISKDQQNSSPVETPHSEALVEAEDFSASKEEPATREELPADPQDSSTALTQSLTRLELNAFEVKLYLDSIDQRISRMEPRLEGLPSPGEPLPPPLEDDPAEHAAPPAALYSKPDVPPPNGNEEQSARQAEKASSRSFLLDLLPAQRSAVPPVLMGVVALLAVLLLHENHRRESTQHQVASVPTVTSAASATLAAPAAAATTVPYTSAPPSPTHPLESAKNSASTIEPQPRTRRLESAEDSVEPIEPRPRKTSAQIPFRSKSATMLPVVAKAPAETRSSTAIRPATPAAPNPTNSASAVLSSVPPFPRRIDVSSGVMAGNLISATPPSYPTLARLTHIRGPVVLQIDISRNGTVQDLHVIKGHRLLRGAAMTAVRTWRYRPYLAHGTATEVATVVSVDVPPR